MFFFFFFKQKTAYEMRISDWSSDVCSSDLRQMGQITSHVLWDRTGQIITRSGGQAGSDEIDGSPESRHNPHRRCPAHCATHDSEDKRIANFISVIRIT